MENNIFRKDGLTTDADIQATVFQPHVQQAEDISMSIINQGIFEDFKDSYLKAGGNETERGLVNKLLAPEAVENYNPLRDSQLTSTYSRQFILDNLSEFSTINSPEEMSNKLIEISRQEEFLQDFAERDLWNIPAIVGFTGGMVFDYSNLVPVGAFTKVAKVPHLIYAAASVAGSQAIRDYASDSFISDNEKKFNVAMAGLVGLGFGGAVVGRQWVKEAAAKDLQTMVVERELQRQKYADENAAFIKTRDDGSVQVHQTFDEWLSNQKPDISITPATGKIADTVLQFRLKYIDGKILPKLRLYTSELPSARYAVDTLVGTSMNTTRRSGNAIEHMIKAESGNMVRQIEEASEVAYMKFINENPGAKIGLKQFEDEFYAGVESANWGNPLMTKYFNEILPKYNEVNKTLWERSKAAGIVDKDAVLPTGKNYKPLAWDVEKALADPIAYKSQLFQAMKSGTSKHAEFLRTRLETMDSSSEAYVELNKLYNKLNKLAGSKEKLNKAVNSYYDNNILGTPSSLKVSNKLDASAKGLEFRENYIDQDLVRDFIDTDFRRGIQKSIRSQTVDHAITTHFGDSKLSKWKDEISKERDELIAKNPNQSAKYQRMANEALEIVAASINRLRGYSATGTVNNGAVHTATSWLGAATTVGLMGKSALSNIPEVFNVARNLKTLSTETAEAFKKAYKASGIKLSKIEAQRLEYNSTLLQETRMNVLNDSPSALSKADRLPQKVTSAAYTFYGQTYVTNLLEVTTANNLIDFIVKVANAGDNASAQELAEIKRLGFKKSDLPKILEQFNANKVTTDAGVLTSGITDWAGNIGVKARAAVHQAVRDVVIVPDSATKPLWFDTAIGRLFGQFKGFMLTAMEKYALTDLQKGGKHFGAMLAMRTVGGTIAYLAREAAVKNIDDIDTDPTTLIHEGLMRGGGLAGLDFISDILDQYGLGLSRALGTNRAAKRMSSYGNDPVLRTVAGAPAAVIGDVTKTVMNVSKRNFDPEAYKHLMKYPFGHIALQAIINKVFD